MRTLVDRHRVLEGECRHLRKQLASRERRAADLEARIRDMNQSRQDAVKRIDDLLGQLERLERRLGPEDAAARAGGVGSR